MNRSIFQIRQKKISLNLIFNIFLSTCTILFLELVNLNVECVNFKNSSELSKYVLEEAFHNNIKVYKSATINDCKFKTALDLFLEYKINNNFSYKFSKYFLNKNGILLPFDKKSPYHHPNLFIGVYNNISINFQFTHAPINNSFKLFSTSDLINEYKIQYVHSYLHMYDINLTQIMLNYDDILLNQQFKYLNNELINDIENNSIKIQKYLNFNKKNFNNLVNDSLKS